MNPNHYQRDACLPRTKRTRRRRTVGSLRRLCLVVAFLAACCSCQPHGTEPPANSAEPATATLQGIVRLAGSAIPVAVRVENSTDPQVCGRVRSIDNLMVSPGTRGIANVIVRLKNVPRDKIPAVAPSRLILDNMDCQFRPRVSVMTVGGTIDATNSDPILHTTHLYGAEEVNIALPFKGVSIPTTVNKPGMIIAKCDIHGWMQAYIQVDDHPFHAVTEGTGRFHISDIPPGTYDLVTWHEILGERQMTISIRSGSAERIEIEYSQKVN